MGGPPWHRCIRARRIGPGLLHKILRDCQLKVDDLQRLLWLGLRPAKARGSEKRRLLTAGAAPGLSAGKPNPERTVTNFEISFPLHFQSFKPRESESLHAPMLPSNRRYAYTTKIQLLLRPPRLPAHRPTRRPLHLRERPNFRLPHLRMRAEDRPVCVTISPVIPATTSSKWTYPCTRNTLNFRILRHRSPSPGPSPSRGRLGRLPQVAQTPQSAAPPAPP